MELSIHFLSGLPKRGDKHVVKPPVKKRQAPGNAKKTKDHNVVSPKKNKPDHKPKEDRNKKHLDQHREVKTVRQKVKQEQPITHKKPEKGTKINKHPVSDHKNKSAKKIKLYNKVKSANHPNKAKSQGHISDKNDKNDKSGKNGKNGRGKHIVAIIFSILVKTIVSALLMSGALLQVLSVWFHKTFGNLNFEEIVFTINSPIKGTNTDIVGKAVKYCLPTVIHTGIMIAVLLLIDGLLLSKILMGYQFKYKNKKTKVHYLKVSYFERIACIIMGVILTINAWGTFDKTLGISKYVQKMSKGTHVFEKYYVKPEVAKIHLKKGHKRRNVIFIYMESMETTYASQAVGGKQPTINYIPNLTALANENVSFSDKEGLGGFHSTNGSTWTMGSLFSQTAGIPWKMPTDNNAMDKHQTFSKNTVTLGDILHKKGYNQEFMCGSDASFAGRDLYFKEHGHYKIFDLNTAKKRGYIPQNYHVWWGYEDAKLYDYAKIELGNLSEKNKPFNFTMLTVDTHFPDGYLCEKCGNTYDTKAGNVIACADNQLNDFINWAKTQPWYDDTTIIIKGDHPRMDQDLVAGVAYPDRTIYNCTINGVNHNKKHLKNRDFTPMDMLPTDLSSIGYKVDRLGMGRNLYTGKKTLAEKMGYTKYNNELGKRSDYYVKHFY